MTSQIICDRCGTVITEPRTDRRGHIIAAASDRFRVYVALDHHGEWHDYCRTCAGTVTVAGYLTPETP